MSKKEKKAQAKGKKAAAAKAGKEPVTQPVQDQTPAPAAAEPKAKKEVKEGALPPLPKLPSAKRPRKPRPTVKCACGCNGDTTSTWVPGHDARAKGWAIRIERGICKLSDVPANERKGAEHMLKVRKDNPPTTATGEKKAKLTVVKGKKAAAETPATEEQPAQEPAASTGASFGDFEQTPPTEAVNE